MTGRASWRASLAPTGIGVAADVANKKGPPCGEPFSVPRMVRHQESKKFLTI